MKRQSKILAGTALVVLMSTSPGAFALPATSLAFPPERHDGASGRSVILVQEGEGVKRKQRRDAERAKRRAEQEQEQAQEAAPEPEEAPAAEEQEAPAAEEQPRRQRRQAAEEPQAEPEANEEPQAEPAAEDPPRRNRREAVEEQERQAEPEREAQPERQAEPEPVEEPAVEEARPEPEPTEEPAPRRERRQAQPESEEAPPADAENQDEARPRERAAEPEVEESQDEPSPAPDEPARAQQPDDDAQEQPSRRADPPAGSDDASDDVVEDDGSNDDGPDEAVSDDANTEDGEGEAQPRRQGRQRLFDSDKETRRAGRDRPAREPVESGPAPENDDDAQDASIGEADRRSVDEEQGVRRERQADRRERQADRRDRDRPEGSEVLREIGDRLILQLGDQVIVESDDRERLSRGARETFVEDLPNGRVRETIVRPNGVRIVTVRNEYGDVVRRSRFAEDGREQILSYVDEDDYGRVLERRDAGEDLPPIRIDIPEEEYILDAGRVGDSEEYYDFLDQPPVEKVERLYSVDEVKRSARVRDIARRVDLDTITFEFGSASIVESEVGRLEGVATAMERLLAENPAETFLIEGHTDAVGTDLANLALSDRRAEAVAQALTDVFGLPPENFATQGYGEEYLKVDAAGPERENRRVAIRRITALVAPVASAQ